jgi:hypothetical protein
MDAAGNAKPARTTARASEDLRTVNAGLKMRAIMNYPLLEKTLRAPRDETIPGNDTVVPPET